jgi:hypothetical protein
VFWNITPYRLANIYPRFAGLSVFILRVQQCKEKGLLYPEDEEITIRYNAVKYLPVSMG